MMFRFFYFFVLSTPLFSKGVNPWNFPVDIIIITFSLSQVDKLGQRSLFWLEYSSLYSFIINVKISTEN